MQKKPSLLPGWLLYFRKRDGGSWLIDNNSADSATVSWPSQTCVRIVNRSRSLVLIISIVSMLASFLPLGNPKLRNTDISIESIP